MVKMLEQRLPIDFKERVYEEPFLGGGAFYAHLYTNGYFRKGTVTEGNNNYIVLRDTNQRLINTYKAIASDVDRVIEHLTDMRQYTKSKDYYLAVREAFNRPVLHDRYEQAARFIYLNQCGFKGLYRENSKGEYNNPFGHGLQEKLFDEENLKRWSIALQDDITYLEDDALDCQDIEMAIESKVFYFLDPPYDLSLIHI